MTAVTLQGLETALLSRLEAAKGPTSFRVVTAYQGRFAEILKGRGADGPAAWLHLQQATERRHAAPGVFAADLEFHVFVAVWNHRGQDEARRGVSVNEPGAMGLMQRVRALLVDQDLGLEMQPIEPTGWKSVMEPGEDWPATLALYDLGFRCRYTYTRPETDEEAAASIHDTSTLALDSDGDETPEVQGQVEHTP